MEDPKAAPEADDASAAPDSSPPATSRLYLSYAWGEPMPFRTVEAGLGKAGVALAAQIALPYEESGFRRRIATETPAGTARPPTGTAVGREGTVSVAVDRGTLKLVTDLTGMADAAELVEFALRLLMVTDPSAEYARGSRGSLPGFDLDI